VKTSIKLNVNYVPSWHLLGILVFCTSSSPDVTDLEILLKSLRVFHIAADTITSGRSSKIIPSENRLDWINLLLTQLTIEELVVLGKPQHNHKEDSSNEVKETLSRLQQMEESFSLSNRSPGNLLSGHRILFSYFFNVFYNVPFKDPMPLEGCLYDLQNNPHPIVQSFYPIRSFNYDSETYMYNSDIYPKKAVLDEPLHFHVFLRKKKQKYMEIWLQTGRFYRSLGLLNDAEQGTIIMLNKSLFRSTGS